MLWIGSGRDAMLAEEVACHTGLKAIFTATDTQEWKKHARRCRVIVLALPASSAFVQEVMSAAQESVRPLPVVMMSVSPAVILQKLVGVLL